MEYKIQTNIIWFLKLQNPISSKLEPKISLWPTFYKWLQIFIATDYGCKKMKIIILFN